MRWRSLHLLIALIVIATGAGAAAGTILQGEIKGVVHMAVSQALIVEKPFITDLPPTKPIFTSVSDNQTAFTAAVEVSPGDKFTINLPIWNKANEDIVAEFILMDVPPDFTITVTGSGVINDVVRIKPFTWKFTADRNADGTTPPSPFDGLKIEVKVGATVLPGFYEFRGTIYPVPY